MSFQQLLALSIQIENVFYSFNVSNVAVRGLLFSRLEQTYFSKLFFCFCQENFPLYEFVVVDEPAALENVVIIILFTKLESICVVFFQVNEPIFAPKLMTLLKLLVTNLAKINSKIYWQKMLVKICFGCIQLFGIFISEIAVYRFHYCSVLLTTTPKIK